MQSPEGQLKPPSSASAFLPNPQRNGYQAKLRCGAIRKTPNPLGNAEWGTLRGICGLGKKITAGRLGQPRARR
jgi:hypothetical protein